MRAHGFTLVEMLVALVAFALLSAATLAILDGALRSKAALAAAADRLQELQMARAVMKADLAQISDRPVRDAFGGPPRAGFQVSRASDRPLLSFVRHGWDNPAERARGSVQYVEYALVDGALVRRARAHPDMTPETPVTSNVLLTDVSRIGIAFLAGGVWSPEWRTAPGAAPSLPDAIAFDLELGGVGAVRQAFLTAGWGAGQ
jgi:general secretion pathway protein J